jgi:hypothetical protein
MTDQEDRSAKFRAMATWELRRVVQEGLYPLGSRTPLGPRDAQAAETVLRDREEEERVNREWQRARDREEREAAKREKAKEAHRQRKQRAQEEENRRRERRRLAFAVAQEICFSARARATFAAAAPSRQAEYREQLAKLRIAPQEGQRRQVDTMDRDKGDCSVFPRGHNSVRIFFYEHTDGTLRVCEIASKYDGTYERLWSVGVFRRDYPDNDFAPFAL